MSKANQLLPSDLLWPDNLDEKIYSGFLNEELERICDWRLRGYDKKLHYKPVIWWMYWPAELYSFGRCYRDWLGIPSWAPLPIYGDHGVSLSGQLASHEIEAKPKVFLTWFKDRAESLGKEKQKEILCIPHPWITFRRKYGIKKQTNAKGTLVFYSHSNTGIEIIDYDWDRYFSELRNLPDQYHPLVVCMHRHDVEKGYHRWIRKYGLPIISAGETSSPFFVERFYDMVSRFEFATSNNGGSELFYCEELGVRYFIYGESPVYVNQGDNQCPLGVMKPQNDVAREAVEKKSRLFGEFPPRSNFEKDKFVRDILGLDIDEKSAKAKLKKALLNEYIRHFPKIFINIFITISFAILPYRCKKFIKNLPKN